MLLSVAISVFGQTSTDGARTPAGDRRGTDEVPRAVRMIAAPNAEDKTATEKQEREKHAAIERQLAKVTAGLFYVTCLLVVTALLQVVMFFVTLRLSRGVVEATYAASAAG
jgi:hypothetical protein